MRKKQWVWILICIASMTMLGIGVTYAMTKVEMFSHITTDKVEIRVIGLQEEKGEEQHWQEASAWLPGMVISRRPQVVNQGSDCYIRAKWLFQTASGETMDVLRETQLPDRDPDWILAMDGYYYYTKVLPKGEQVDLLCEIPIPTDLPQEEWENTSVHMTICVDAIQSGSFTPRYSERDPWGDVEILQYKRQDSVEISYAEQREDKVLSTIYLGDLAQWVTDDHELFEEKRQWMPGDQWEDSIVLANDSGKTLELYLRSHCEESSLWDQLRIRIDLEQNETRKRLYEGSVTESVELGERALETLEEGEQVRLWFVIQVPEQLDNTYAEQSGTLRWILSDREIPQKIPEEVLPESTVPVATGDDAVPEWYAGGLVLAFVTMLTAMIALWRGGWHETIEKEE